MAARLNPRHQEMVRDKIRASQLVNVLENHVLKGSDLSPTQVSAALGLLKKCVPDLSATALTGPDGGPIQTENKNELSARIKERAIKLGVVVLNKVKRAG